MKTLLAALAMLSLSLAGCSGSTSTDCGTEISEGEYLVCMTSAFTFEPSNLKVPEGSTVTWRFDGGGAHDTEADNGEWASTMLTQKGATFSHTFDEAGTYSYRCNPHVGQGMVGVVTVEA